MPINRPFAGHSCGTGVARSACHAEGRGFESLQPLRKTPAFAGLFDVRSRLVRLRRVGLTPDSPRADRRPFQEKRPVCRPILVRPNRSPSAGLQKVRCSACCDRYPDSCCNGTILRTAPTGAIPAVAVLGASPVSVRKPRGQPRPLRDPASHGTQSREPQDGVRDSGVPHHGELVSRQSHGGSSPKMSLSIGKQASARTWAGLLVVVRSERCLHLRRDARFQ